MQPKIINDDGVNVHAIGADGQPALLTYGAPGHDEMIMALKGAGSSGGGAPVGDAGAAAPSAPASDDAMFNTMPAPSAPGAAMVPPAAAMPAPMADPQLGNPPPVAPAPMAPMAAAAPMAMDMKSENASKTKSTGVTAAAQAGLRRAHDAQVNAVKAEYDALPTAQDKAAVDSYQAHVDELVQKQAEREERYHSYIDTTNKALAESQQKLSEMKVDADAFGRSDTGNKILAGVSIMLGALGQGIKGSNENVGLTLVQKAIERDIDAQKTNIMNAHKTQESARGGFETFLKATGDERIATNAEMQRQLDLLKATLQKNLAGNADKASGAALKKTIADIDAKYADLDAKNNTYINENANQSSVEVAPAKGKQKENAPTDVRQKIADTEESLRQMDQLVGMARANPKLGWAGRITEIKGKLGMQDADEAALEAAIIAQVAAKTHKISGAGSNEKEVARLASTLGRLKDNPEAFFAKLDAERSRLEKELVATRDANKDLFQLPKAQYETTIEKAQRDKKLGFTPSK